MYEISNLLRVFKAHDLTGQPCTVDYRPSPASGDPPHGRLLKLQAIETPVDGCQFAEVRVYSAVVQCRVS